MVIVPRTGLFFESVPGWPARMGRFNSVALGVAIPMLGESAPAPSPVEEPMDLPAAVARDWADKIDLYMKQVQSIQDFVRAHPEEALASGLSQDASALPSSGDLAAWPKMKALYDKLRAGQPVLEADLDLVPALGVALISANQKLPPEGLSLSPLQLGIGVGILALGIGIMVLS